jgi:hypothetical protein
VAELRLQREKLEQHFRDLAEARGTTDVLEKLRELRERSEKNRAPEKDGDEGAKP